MAHFARSLVAFAVVAYAGPVHADPIAFAKTSGTRAASVTFESSAHNLIVRLKNTSLSDVGVPTDVLTGVFFNVAGNPALARTSAALGAGSTVLFGGTDAGAVVGGEWAYRNGLNQYAANSGISSSGLNLFGPHDRFPGSNLQGPESPNGLQYGITSAGDQADIGNAKVTGDAALIKNEMVFTLGNWLLGDPTPYISNVTFQYGTSLSEPHLSGDLTVRQVPEPSVVLLLGVGGIAAWRRLRRVRSRHGEHGELATENTARQSRNQP
jgi:hypothetical protein